MLTDYPGALEKQAYLLTLQFGRFIPGYPPKLNFMWGSSIRPFTLDSPWFCYLLPMVSTAVKTETEIIMVKQILPGKHWLQAFINFPSVFFLCFQLLNILYFVVLPGSLLKICFQYIIKHVKLFLYFGYMGCLSLELKFLFWSLWEKYSLTKCLRYHSDIPWDGEDKTLTYWLIFLKISSVVLQIFI